METPKPLFDVGEIAILQPPHPSAKAYWGMETVILERVWGKNHQDAFGGRRSGWSYKTDIPAPPPSDEPHYRLMRWIWCEYDLRKKYDAGDELKTLLKGLNDLLGDEALQSEREVETA